MWMIDIPPFLFLFVAALVAAVTGGVSRGVLVIILLILSAINILGVQEGIHFQISFLDYQLIPYRVDKLSLIFGYIFHIAALIGVIYSLHVRDRVQQVAALMYAGSGLGAVFAGDLLTLFIFWELLAFTSVFLIWARRTQRAYVAGMRYLVIQVLSGVLLFVGCIFYFKEHNTLAFGHIGLEGIAGWLIFISFGIKCAFPFAHNWLTDAYPEATVTGTVFLSAFTTKVAVYALARGYAGTELLIYIGAAMACFPIFFAVIENDLRRVLAYSLLNQVGFMVVGVGVGTALALNGAVSHAFNDVIFKGLLFMSMGAVLQMTGRINGSDLGGLYKSMPKTTVLCIIGAASISAFPLFNGFVSKSMVMSAVLQEGFNWVWLMLLFASAGVFHHAGIKIPYFAFFAHDSGIRSADPPVNMLLAMTISAILCMGIGIYPQALYALLPFDIHYNPYDATHVLAQTQLLFFSALAFVWLNHKGLYPPELRSTHLDFDWFYRRAIPNILKKFFNYIWSIDAMIRTFILSKLSDFHTDFGGKSNRLDRLLSKEYLLGSMVMWVVVVLAIYLFLNIFNDINNGR